jgi:hypothetical protein
MVISAGMAALSIAPPQPPSARLAIMYIGLFMSAGVAWWNTSVPSTYQTRSVLVQSTP